MLTNAYQMHNMLEQRSSFGIKREKSRFPTGLRLSFFVIRTTLALLVLPPPGSVEPEGKQVQTMGRGSILRRPNRDRFLRTKNVYKRGEEEIRKRRWWLVASLLVAAWAAPQWPSC